MMPAPPQRLGLLGGTFDPIHCGHIHAARVAQRELDLDQVHMIVAARPGHRHPPEATPEQRLAMLELACAREQHLIADPIELNRPGKSYAADTVACIKGQYPDAELFWILGEDAYDTLTEWHRWAQLISLCHMIVLRRPGYSGCEPAALTALREAPDHTQIAKLSEAMLDLSATQIRDALRLGRAVDHWLNPAVAAYIDEQKLYVNQEDSL